MKTKLTFTLSLAVAILAASASAQAESLRACAHKVTGQLRIVENATCQPSEREVQLATPRVRPDNIPIPPLSFIGLGGPTGNDANAVPFNPHMVIRATLRSDGDSRNSVSVRAVNSWPLNPDYIYDGFYICLGFSPEISDSQSMTIFVEHSSYLRANSTQPVIAKRDFARVNPTVGAFRAGTPSQGTTAACLTFPFSQMTKTPSSPYGELGDFIAGPGLFSVTLDTPEMLATKPSGPFSSQSTNIIGLGLVVSGLAPTQP